MTRRIYLFVRRDLRMRRGKEIAQACHAVLGLGAPDGPIVTLTAESAEDLAGIEALAREHGLPFHLVRDAGRTEVPPGTATVIAVLAEEGRFPGWIPY